jgi:hypothetical protein
MLDRFLISVEHFKKKKRFYCAWDAKKYTLSYLQSHNNNF